MDRRVFVGAALLAAGCASTRGYSAAPGAEDLVRRFYDAVTRGDEAALRAILHPQWEEIPPVYPGQPLGPEGYIPLVRAFRDGLSELRFEIHEIIAAGPKYTVRSTIHGIHSGPLIGRPATGRRVSFGAIDIHEVAGEVIRRSWHIEDWGAFLQQTV